MIGAWDIIRNEIEKLSARLETAEAELRRLRGISGVWCHHHGMLDGCGVALADGRALIAERELSRLRTDADRGQK